MRIRSIKPEFWRSEDVNGMQLEDRLLFIGLWSYVDDNGVGKDQESAIVADLFAHDLSVSPHDTLMRVSGGLKRLCELGVIKRYSVENRAYLEIANWSKHQKINRPSPPRYPRSDADQAVLTESSLSDQDTYSAGAGEQGNRGTEEQSSSSDVASDDHDGGDDAPEFSEDVHQLCDYLAENIKRNGNKVGKVGKRWHQAMDRLLRVDGYTPSQVQQVIDWSQQDEFWQGNILSASKLREKFDQLKTRMLNERNKPTSTGPKQYQNAAEKKVEVARHWLSQPTSQAPADPWAIAPNTRKEIEE